MSTIIYNKGRSNVDFGFLSAGAVELIKSVNKCHTVLYKTRNILGGMWCNFEFKIIVDTYIIHILRFFFSGKNKRRSK